jgi:SAM-dependent methyltransferase
MLLKGRWNGRQFDRIIDVGSGGGAMVSLLREFGRSITLLEPNESLAEHTREHFRSDQAVDVHAGTLESFDKKNYYDFVALFDVLEHIEDDAKALSRIHALMKKGGHLVLTVPAFQFLWSRHDDMNGHKRRYTRDELVAKLSEQGFVVEHATYFNTFLFPIVILVRLLGKWIDRKSTDFSIGSGITNSLLYYIFSAERALLYFINLPFGVSIYLLSKKVND